MENKEHMINLGQFIAKHRKDKGYTQQQVADLMGIAVKTISYVECGRNFPTLQNLFKLSELLDMSLDEFIFGYNRFDSSLNIGEINEMLPELNLRDQGVILSLLRAACKSMLNGNE